MSDAERQEYLNSEVENVISSAQPFQQLKLRAQQARLNAIRNKYKNAPPKFVAGLIFDEMTNFILR